jgi:hypothetical protein
MIVKRYIFFVCLVVGLAACDNLSTQALSSSYSASNNKIATAVGVKDEPKGMISASGKAGFLVYGPYETIEPGVYRLVAKGKLVGPAAQLGTFDVTSDKGQRILASRPIYAAVDPQSSVIATLLFEVETQIPDAEFRIQVQEQVTGTFTAFEIIRIASKK